MTKKLSVTVRAALIAAVVSAIISAATVYANYSQFAQLRKDGFQQAAAIKRLEAAQGYYKITFQWLRNERNLDQLRKIEKELDVYHQSHALYLTTEGRKITNLIITSMWAVTRVPRNVKHSDDMVVLIQNVSGKIPIFHEELLKSVWLEPEPRDSNVYRVRGI